MNLTELIQTGIYAGLFLVLFTLGELLYHVAKLPVEITRKFVHVGTGLICLSFPIYLGSHWSVLILTLLFILILAVTQKKKWLPSINAVNRKTNGSFLFPVVIYTSWWAYSVLGWGDMDGNGLNEHFHGTNWHNGPQLYFFLPILILSISDPSAALVGKQFRLGKYKIFGCTKTLIGSFAFLLTSFGLSLFFLIPHTESISNAIMIALVIGVSTTLAEAFSQKGFDNLFIPSTTVLVLYLFNNSLLL